ncbi:hypothetical protein B0T24DRAFT_635652 [Lasiosphaeria ovina]|uniref:BZIP domain-containing protein n=2 Tax=Lasiosphaeria TaxID=92901 RepID=A0AAE0K0K7_9PEZI|nr:hypothetical protein B0T24DRAFT_635652 [Lasiosphaeria ovina]
MPAGQFNFDTDFSPASTDLLSSDLTCVNSPSLLDQPTGWANLTSLAIYGETSSPTSSTSGSSLHSGLALPKAVSQPKKRGRPPASPAPEGDGDDDLVAKRQRNNVAAKKYRQKKLDRIQELEEEVDEVKRERDELRISLARKEAETAALREMLKMATANSAKGSP